MIQKLGKYEIQSVLGEGAMGVVYRAWDPVLKRLVALKTITGDFQDNPELLNRFYREAQSAGGLRHYNIVTIYDLGEENHQPFIAMEFLEGTDLQGQIQRKKIQTLNRVLHILRQCCEGLNYAHSRGIVHRDVKPANVFVLDDGTIKIVDFGIAMVGSSTMTKTGMVMGTVSYMSPEQVQGQSLDGRSDQFSLGIILYEILANRKPFSGNSIPEIFFKIMNETPAPVETHYRHCPPLLAEILSRSLEKNRDRRYPDLAQMARDLERLLGSLKKEYTLAEPVALGTDHSAEMIQAALDEIRALAEGGNIVLAQQRLDEIQKRWGGQDPVIDVRLDALRGRIRYVTGSGVVRQHLENIQALAGDGKFQQAEALLENLEKDYPQVAEISMVRAAVLEAKRTREKFHFIKSNISNARLNIEVGDYDHALKTLGQALQVYPEEKSLLGFYRKTLERQDAARRKEAVRMACAAVSLQLKDGHREQALRILNEALEKFPDEEILQNLYRNLVVRKKQDGLS